MSCRGGGLSACHWHWCCTDCWPPMSVSWVRSAIMPERKDSHMKRKGLVQSLVLAGVLAVGFTVVWGLIAFWALQVGTHVVAGISPHMVMIHVRSVLFFLPDGTPVVGYQQSDRHREL